MVILVVIKALDEVFVYGSGFCSLALTLGFSLSLLLLEHGLFGGFLEFGFQPKWIGGIFGG
jgi:hypothetical protein